MKIPFIVMALPRSRTAWMSKFLSYPPRSCAHDLVLECSSIQEYLEALGRFDGTIETGAMLGWRVLRKRMPLARIAVVRREKKEVLASLAKFGINWAEPEMNVRDDLLASIAQAPGVLSLRYEELNTREGCKALFEHCLEIPFDSEWWEAAQNLNIQIDMRARLEEIASKQHQLLAFREEIRLENEKIDGGLSCLGLN